MKTEDLLNQIAFIKEIDKVKYIQRKTKLFNSDRNENDAEHSWHLALMTIVLAEHSNEPIDVLTIPWIFAVNNDKRISPVVKVLIRQIITKRQISHHKINIFNSFSMRIFFLC